LRAAYASAPFYDLYEPDLRELYSGSCDTHLSAINSRFIRHLCGVLGIRTRISHSMGYELSGDRNQRLIGMCRQVGANEYLSGPSARSYIDLGLFKDAGIEVSFFDYSGYREYVQLYPPFEHHVSVLDLILAVGPEAPRYLLTYDRFAGTSHREGAASHGGSQRIAADASAGQP
jgi:hypothetical protein